LHHFVASAQRFNAEIEGAVLRSNDEIEADPNANVEFLTIRVYRTSHRRSA
jgi:hypothetical protein